MAVKSEGPAVLSSTAYVRSNFQMHWRAVLSMTVRCRVEVSLAAHAPESIVPRRNVAPELKLGGDLVAALEFRAARSGATDR
jgi:hypothetical protein